jgi:hypothetical protein
MKKRLKDIADFRMGYQFRGKVVPDPAGTVRLIQIKDIDPDLRIRVADLATITIERPDPHLTRQGDVLFLSRGHRLCAVVVPTVEPNTIAAGYFLVLRAKDRVVLPEYLAWSINQPDFQASLRPLHQGTHMPMVSKTNMENVEIQLPPLDVQRRILTLNHLLDEERRLSAVIYQRRSLLVQAVSRKLMLEQRTNKED